MRVEVLEAIRALFVGGAACIVFGVAWGLGAPPEWGMWGMIVALVGFIAVSASASIRLFVIGEDRLQRWW
jgi:hypothetical protein